MYPQPSSSAIRTQRILNGFYHNKIIEICNQTRQSRANNIIIYINVYMLYERCGDVGGHNDETFVADGHGHTSRSQSPQSVYFLLYKTIKKNFQTV